MDVYVCITSGYVNKERGKEGTVREADLCMSARGERMTRVCRREYRE